MSESLTLAESVSLAAAHVQRLLRDDGVRSLLIKGPAFTMLGIRPERVSNDVDILIPPDDVERATAAMVAAGWTKMSVDFPRQLDSVAYSTTLRHPYYMSSVDMHHTFSGIGPGGRPFERLWATRTTVSLAHVSVDVPSFEHSLVIEALNIFKSTRPEEWASQAALVIEGAHAAEASGVASAARDVGADWTAAPLVRALGGEVANHPLTLRERHWQWSAGRAYSIRVASYCLVAAPHRLPRVLWHVTMLNDESARLWAELRGQTYRSRRQVMGLRLRGALRK